MLIKVTGDNDAQRTESLKAQLISRLNHCADGYEWHNGEPLYHGQPTYQFFALQAVFFREAITLEELHVRCMIDAFGEHGQG